MKISLCLASQYYASVQHETLPLKKIPQLHTLLEETNTLSANDGPVELPCPPVGYRTDNRQILILNPQQVLLGAHTIQLHAESRVSVRRIENEADLPLARLLYEVVQPAQLFGDVVPLLHAAFSDSHQNALLKRHFFLQSLDRSITTSQLLLLCGHTVQKSTLNALKKKLGYTRTKRPAQVNATYQNARALTETYQ